ncbi:hypothetical protein KY285_002839 [Solanum tuberosum]|nr:hypothetical protein KY285_002839 [Solanum tuberosum]
MYLIGSGRRGAGVVRVPREILEVESWVLKHRDIDEEADRVSEDSYEVEDQYSLCSRNQMETRHWRPGPAEKPVLCNACGSRWRIRGTLQNYIPRHARETQSNQLPAEMNPRLLTRDNQRLQVGVEASGQEGSSACLEEEMNSIPSLVSAGSSSVNCMQMEETNDKDPFWNPNNVPKRKRSERRQRILSPVERLQRQLYNNLQELEFENIPDGDEDVTLIYARNKYIPPNEIGLGAMLLVSPTTTTERSTSQFSMAEDNACSSMNVPVENPYLINNNILDHVAVQNETTGNERGKAIARENRLAPHHMDTISRVSGQKLHSQRDGAKLGSPVKRPRGRPRLSTTQGRKVEIMLGVFGKENVILENE